MQHLDNVFLQSIRIWAQICFRIVVDVLSYTDNNMVSHISHINTNINSTTPTHHSHLLDPHGLLTIPFIRPAWLPFPLIRPAWLLFPFIRPAWLPFSLIRPAWLPFSLIRPAWLPFHFIRPARLPFHFIRPARLPFPLVRPAWLPFF